MIKLGCGSAARPYPHWAWVAVNGMGADSQRLPDIPGLPDLDSVEEWLSLLLNVGASRVSADCSHYVIFIGNSL